MKNKEILDEVLEIGIQLSKIKDYKKLFQFLLDKSMELSHSDAGTLYMKDGDVLQFMVVKNHTLGQNVSGPSLFPPVPLSLDNVSSYALLKREVLNVEDCYHDPNFYWTGPKAYDARTGYHTKSMCVIPLINHENEAIGVLQLLNAMDSKGEIISYSKEIEYILESLASQVAIILSNMLLNMEIEDLLDSFVESLVTAIDSRTPYNGNHSRNVAKLCKEFLEYLKEEKKMDIPDSSIEQLYLSGLIHDVGKMSIPESILDKPTRLGNLLPLMEARWSQMKDKAEIQYLKKNMSLVEYQESICQIDFFKKTIEEWNNTPLLEDKDEKLFQQMKDFSIDGISFLTEEEILDLSIVRGTLNPKERLEIEKHAEYSETILSKIHFGKKYNHVLEYVSKHHELLDGSGYPMHYQAKDLPFEVRVLTMMDIFESLSAKDRPYKRQIPLEKCLEILSSMAKEGKLDATIVNLFIEYKNSGK